MATIAFTWFGVAGFTVLDRSPWNLLRSSLPFVLLKPFLGDDPT
jgi:hypothetical protein